MRIDCKLDEMSFERRKSIFGPVIPLMPSLISQDVEGESLERLVNDLEEKNDALELPVLPISPLSPKFLNLDSSSPIGKYLVHFLVQSSLSSAN